MLHLLYILAFTTLAFIAVGNLIRNLLTLGIDSTRSYSSQAVSPRSDRNANSSIVSAFPSSSGSHPELFDDMGKVIDEPLLIMRSITVEDAREQLDALYNASPESTGIEGREEA